MGLKAKLPDVKNDFVPSEISSLCGDDIFKIINKNKVHQKKQQTQTLQQPQRPESL